MEACKRLKSYIGQRGISKAWLSREVNAQNPALNFSVKTLEQCLNGRRALGANEFLYVCIALKTEPDKFI